MKQELFRDQKASPPAPAARARVFRAKESPRVDSANGASPGLKARPKAAPLEPTRTQKARRSIQFNKLKPGIDDVGSPKEKEVEDSKIMGRPANRVVEQYASLRRRGDLNYRGSEHEADEKSEELQRRLDASEGLVRELQSEVSALKAQLQKLQGINIELETQKKKLGEELCAAEEKIKHLECHSQDVAVAQEVQPSGFREAQKLIANKLQIFNMKKEVVMDLTNKLAEVQPKMLNTRPSPPSPTLHVIVKGPPPPPPPPPPSRHVPAKSNAVHKASALVELYNSLTKRDGKKDAMGIGNCLSPISRNPQHSIVGELQNRSAHLLAIKADVETKGDFIRDLIEKVRSAAFTNMEDVLTFVDSIDRELSTLSDERAVLKHFNWPERKADALREAAFEYRDLKSLEAEVHSFGDEACIPCETTLRKSSNLLDKLEKGMNRLIKLRHTNMLSYRECQVPTDWMQDSGMVSKIKLASVKLAKVYMKRVLLELDTIRNQERETAQEALLFQGVRFAYRVHQFAGGLDSETMSAFEELRGRVRSHQSGSRELLPTVMLS
ncbi:INCREASED PETAL GROWTH ANISOTROPY 1-like protein 2 isoform X2 [Typha angustifolia]